MTQFFIKVLSAWQLVLRRMVAHWRLLSWMFVGVILASTMMAGTAIYFESLRELSLRHVLKTYDPNDLDVFASYANRPTTRSEYNRISTISSTQFESRLDWLVSEKVGGVKTATMALTLPGDEDLAGDDDRRTYFAYVPELDQFVDLVDGKMPQAIPLGAMLRDLFGTNLDPIVVEAIVPIDAADLLDVEVGDVLSAIPFSETDVPYARVRITGVFEREDPNDDFWHFYEEALEAGTVLTVQTLPLFVSEGTYFDLIGSSFDSLNSKYSWLLDIDTDRINAQNSSLASFAIDQTGDWINVDLPGYKLSTSLLTVLKIYDTRLFFTKIPMFMFFILISVVILYYIVTISSLLVDRNRSEMALLCSRGSSSTQILLVFALEGASLALIAALTGPIIAAGSISLMGLTSAFSDLSGGSFLVVNITKEAYVMSSIGAILGFFAMLYAGSRASKLGVTKYRQDSARPTSQPVFQRYYLDVLILVVGIILFRQLSEQGSVLATSFVGETVVNQMLLAAPALVLLAVATILLRVYPLVMRLVSGLLLRRSPAGIALGLWQMSRNPSHYARISLLLILTAGLGVFSSSFVATLERSFEERVLYSTGSEVRVEGIRTKTRGLSKNVREAYEDRFAAIEFASPAYRGRGFDAGKPQGRTFTVLAVDVDSFLQTAWFRDDFSDEPIEDLLKSLAMPVEAEGLRIPETADTIGVVMKANVADPDVWVIARIKDANDRYESYRLGPMGAPDYLGNLKEPTWQSLDAALELRHRIAAPITLISLGVYATQNRGRLPRGSILIDEITIGHMEGKSEIETEVIEGFDDLDGWSTLRLSPSAQIDDLTTASSIDRDSGLARFSWNTDQPMVGHGIFYSPGLPRLSVLASESFMTSLGYSRGDEALVLLDGRKIPVQIVNNIKLFPTLNPVNEKFLVADLSALKRYANLDLLDDELQPNEMWMSLSQDYVDRPTLVEELSHEPFLSGFVQDRQKLLEDFQVDPLARAGWNALLLVAFTAVLVLSCMGFLMHTFVSFRERESSFAIMRSMGLAIKQLITMVWLEQFVVIVVGMAVGTWMGSRLVGSIMPFLAHDERGVQLVPPFAVEIDWGTLWIVYVAMVLIFAIIMSGAILFVYRISIQNSLRMGDN